MGGTGRWVADPSGVLGSGLRDLLRYCTGDQVIWGLLRKQLVA